MKDGPPLLAVVSESPLPVLPRMSAANDSADGLALAYRIERPAPTDKMMDGDGGRLAAVKIR
jgi:hypothetical protein